MRDRGKSNAVNMQKDFRRKRTELAIQFLNTSSVYVVISGK